MRASARGLVFALVVIAATAGICRAYAANPAVDFLEEIFRQQDQKRKQRQDAERGARQVAPRPQPQRPRTEISDVTFTPPAVAKNADAKIILVVGDEMAAGLTEGLVETYATDPTIKVEGVSRPGVGVIGDTGTNWTELVREAMGRTKPVAIVIMFGLNDRQALIEGDRIIDFRGDRWRDIYQARLDAFLNAFGEYRARLYWTGLPAMRAERDLQDASLFSDLFKARTFTASARFVDVWEGFVDEDGKYVAVGPDVNGSRRRLRKADGVNFTPAGNRKLAFFVDTALKQAGTILDAPLIAGLELPTQREAPDVQRPAGSPLAPIGALSPKYVGPVVQLTPVPVKANAELANAPAPRSDFASGILQRGDPLPTRAGRADDARWPPPDQLASQPAADRPQTEARRAGPAP